MDAKAHKLYQPHAHIDTPYPVLEHSDTFSSVSSTGSSGSFLDIRKHHIPNPVSVTSQIIEDHIAEFKFGHASRAAKREAQRSAHHSSHPWSLDAAQIRAMSIPENEEDGEEWRERDRKAWEAELKKREAARRRSDLSHDWVGGWTVDAGETKG